ncbi:MAG: prolyl oligopeptidase family serine peptidase [Pseudonocardiaceae bacterium]
MATATPQQPTNHQPPYGAWPSPIDSATVANAQSAPAWPAYVGDEVWWNESRPEEGGRITLMRSTPNGPVDVLPKELTDKDKNPWNVRSRVIEYGGRSWTALPTDKNTALPTDKNTVLVVFSHFNDQCLYAYKYTPDKPSSPYPITSSFILPSDAKSEYRYITPVLNTNGSTVWCLRETLTDQGDGKPPVIHRDFVSVSTTQNLPVPPVELLTEDHDFLAGPTLSPPPKFEQLPPKYVAWLGWNRPHKSDDRPSMPWDGTELRVGEFNGMKITNVQTVLGRQDLKNPENGVSVTQIEWLDENTLLACADHNSNPVDNDRWWNLYTIKRDEKTQTGWGEPQPLWQVAQECGGPLWGLGFRWFAPLPPDTNAMSARKIAVLHGVGPQRLSVLTLNSEKPEVHDYATDFEWEGYLDVHAGHVVGVAGNATKADTVTDVDLTTGESRFLSTSSMHPELKLYFPEATERTFHRPSGGDVHTIVCPPHNPNYTVLPGKPPPYVAFVHGGPTARDNAVLDLSVAYFTSRGIGVVKINYGGSTGYGRTYRERLYGQWGQVDVQDAVDVVNALTKNNEADGTHLAVRGGSAGGWTSAAALTFDPTHTFACANIMYPVLDLVSFDTAGGTHDFEAHYVEILAGYDKTKYPELSPINNTGNIQSSFVLMQGLEDPICKPEQCYDFLKKVSENSYSTSITSAYFGFSGEQHHFRMKKNIITALEAELFLYGRTFDFLPLHPA